jgi:rhodanese-related sulfurtransferase
VFHYFCRLIIVMKQKNFLKVFFSIAILIWALQVAAQNPVNWVPGQLIEPTQLAQAITSNKDVPTILSVGPGAPIPHSVEIGSIKDADSFEKFKQQLSTLKKDASIVVYCGCCPFEHCPNVRPAIATLKEMKFTNYKLLNLPKNLKADWLDKGYPTKD